MTRTQLEMATLARGVDRAVLRPARYLGSHHRVRTTVLGMGVAAAFAVAMIPVRDTVGAANIALVLVIGVVVDITLPWIPDAAPLVVRIALMLGGVVVIAIGSGFYIGAGLGPGPRDGLMTGLAKRSVGGFSISIRVARTTVEIEMSPSLRARITRVPPPR